MLKQKMQDAINRQMNREMYSAYLYLSMAAYFDSLKLRGFSHWMQTQVMEELIHTRKFYDYLVAKGGRAVMAEIESPPVNWASPLAAFEYTLKHEKFVTGLIHKLVDVAAELKDSGTREFLQWYIKEQVEEEESAEKAVAKLKLAGKTRSKLLATDKAFGRRPAKHI
jgi:ferritin